MSNPKISVIVPVYNVAPYLARCLDSLVAQTLSDIEIICIDDKSTDNSLKILHEYENKYPQIHVIALDKNSGVATARNAGIDAARGEYLGFVDSDDYIDADFYEKLYATAKTTGADIVRGEAKITDDGKTSVLGANHVDNIKTFGKWRFMFHWWTAIYRHKMIDQHKITFPVDIISGQDIAFLSECINVANKVSICTGTFYNYIRREGSLDEHVLSPAKITSKINALKQIFNIYNNASMNDADYIACYYDRWEHMMSLANKSTRADCRLQIAEAVIEAYKSCKNKNDLLKLYISRGERNRYRTKYIQSYDAAGWLSQYTNSGTPCSTTRPDANKYNKIYKKTFWLFSLIPVATLKRNLKYTKMRICGLDVIKVKSTPEEFRLYILYLPILRVKNK